MLESLEPAEGTTSSDDVTRLAHAALEHATRRGVPPDPKAFELFFGYASGDDDALVRAVDAAFDVEGGGGLDAVDRLFEEHVAFGPDPHRFLEVGALLEREMGDISASLARRAESDGRFLGELTRARDGMTLFSRPGSVKQVVRELLETTEAYAEQTRLFAAELEVARAQMDEMRQEMKALRESAYHDHLTGLANRRRFDVEIGAQCASRAPGAPFSLVLADIDHFKRINDRFGHAVGDSVLTQFGRIVRECVRGQDTAARYGGEEFAVVLPETSLLGARHLAEKIRQELASRSFVITGSRRRIGMITASLGVAEHREGEAAADLAKRTDAALYRAKQSGRNRVSAAME